MSGMRLCPPASTFASPGCCCNNPMASVRLRGAKYSNLSGITATLLSLQGGPTKICGPSLESGLTNLSPARKRTCYTNIPYNKRFQTGKLYASPPRRLVHRNGIGNSLLHGMHAWRWLWRIVQSIQDSVTKRIGHIVYERKELYKCRQT